MSVAGHFPDGWTGKFSFPMAGAGNFPDDCYAIAEEIN